jgi:hypothetical protein
VPRILVRAAAVIGLLGCIAFILSIGILGGTAANGKIVDGQHYLGEHGQYVAVSPDTYRLSQWITRVALLSWLLAGLGFAILHRRPDPALEVWGVATAVLAIVALLVCWVLLSVGLSPVLAGVIAAVASLGGLAIFANGRRSLKRQSAQEAGRITTS